MVDINHQPYLTPTTTSAADVNAVHSTWTIGGVLGSLFLTAVNSLLAIIYTAESIRFFYGDVGPCGTCEGETILFLQTWGLLIFALCIVGALIGWWNREPLYRSLIASAIIAVGFYVVFCFATHSDPFRLIYYAVF